MPISRETVMAYIDGELSPGEAHRVEAAIAGDPALSAYVEEQRAMKARLDAAFAPILSAPIPERLERMVLNAPAPKPARNTVSLAVVMRRLWDAPATRVWIPAGTVAAGIAFGLLLADAFNGGTMIENRGGALVAEGPLARALSTQLAAQQDSETAARIGVSFLNKDGNFCRSFVAQGGDDHALAGVACRNASDWQIVATSTTEVRDPNLFQQASASMPASLRAAVNEMISGAPLDATAEREARDRNWRTR